MTTEDGPGAATSPADALEPLPSPPPAEPVLPDMTARRLAEVVDRYRALVQVTGQITWTTTPEGTFGDASAWCIYTGQSPAEVQGWGGMEAIHPDDRGQAQRSFLESIATRTPYEAEYRVRRFDGEYRWFLARGVPIAGDDGAVREWVGFSTDITERKRSEDERIQLLARERAAHAQAALQAQQLEAIFDTVADGIFVFGSQGEVLHANAAARGFFALDAAPTFYAAPMHERGYATTVRDERDQPLPEQEWPFSRVLRGEVLTGAKAVDLMVRTGAGREWELNVSGAPVYDAERRIVSAVCVVRDVTARRRLERRTHEALQALLQVAQALVLAPDESDDALAPGETEVRSVGQRLVELTRRVLGCQRASIIAVDPTTNLQHPVAVAGLSPEHERLWAQRLDGAPVDGTEAPDPSVAPRLRAGAAVILDLSAPPWNAYPNPFGIRTVLVAPMRVGPNLVGTLSLDYAGAEHAFTPQEVALAGAVAQLAALIIERDHLLRKRAETQADELALREANRRMDEFLAIASHELKTPLTSLKGFVQLAQRRAARTRADDGAGVAELLDTLGAVQRVLERAGEQINRMDRLASDLIDVSRIQAGRLEMRIARCDLAAIVRDAVEGQRHLDVARRIDERIAPDLAVPVDGDPDRLGQVVTNYLTNALKYSTVDRPVVVGLDAGSRTARVWVRDEGPGVPVAEQEHIWKQFYRAPGIAYRSGSGVGLGMGLHISRTIVERHGGQVGVESVPGAGATFWFTIPRAVEAEADY